MLKLAILNMKHASHAETDDFDADIIQTTENDNLHHLWRESSMLKQ
jgi:hypothetical protein